MLATFGTLTFVPILFSLMHRNDPAHAQVESRSRGEISHE
jgi:hypothetical protein